MCRVEGFIVGINMREDWKAGNEGRVSTDAGVVQEKGGIILSRHCPMAI